MLKHTLSQINSPSSCMASDVVKKIDVLLAIRWVMQAWEAVKEETVVNCFKHCGVQPTTEDFSEDPFSDLDQHDEELDELVKQLDPDMPLTTTEYVAADEDVATCATFENSANWRQELWAMVVSDCPCSKIPANVEDEEEEESDEELLTDKITTYNQAIRCGNDMLVFLMRKGEEQLSESMLKIIQHLQNDKLHQCRQTSILDYTL